VWELDRNADRADSRYKYVEPHLQWQWIDESYMEEYEVLWENATRFHVVSTFFIGAMILNRVIAFIDVRAATKSGGGGSRVAVRAQPSVSPDGVVGLFLKSRF
jgi:hypothetical protein